MSYDHASMLCCGLGPTFGALQRMEVSAEETILITGMGPVGLGGVINTVHRGARVIATAHNEYRAELARTLGAEVIIDDSSDDTLKKKKELTHGLGVDAAIESAGATEAQQLCLNAVRRNGQVAFVGESGDVTVKISDQLIRNGLHLHGVWHYNLNDVPALFDVAIKCADKLDQLITHTFPLANVIDAWELQLSRQCGKVILHPWKN